MNDPRMLVEAPVRGALTGVMARGIALVGTLAVLAFWPALTHADAAVRDGVVAAAVLVLAGYVVLVRVTGLQRGRPPMEARERAWDRAREIDKDEASLGLLVAGWVPAGLLLALALMVWPHLTDPNPALAAAWTVLGLPPVAMAWMMATTTWLDACRDDLARAEQEADLRFRRYWADVGR
jgi:hypothetical protein